jgi:molecular chaperone GrpE
MSEASQEITGENPDYIVVSATLAKGWQEQAAKAAEAQDKLIRTLAEWDNSRKRLAKEKEDAIRFANEALLENLIPVVDNFELGMQAAATAADAKSIAVGLSMVLSQVQNLLRESGLEVIDAVNKPFDPHQQEAIGHQPSDKVPEGHVISQTRKGYLLKGKLVRAANVIVSQGKAEKGKSQGKAETAGK